MRRFARNLLTGVALASSLFLLGSTSTPGRAATLALCAPAPAVGTRLAATQTIATCDECRTSGRRAGYKRCCELVGGDYVCEWVRC
ncbi:MAG: hypothetical protein NZ555_05290 [Geminicoccaceae bacterium]|nr:hypothetical protein [Geminicoccaceae bacterium]MCX8101757.1 hypothetical protein [Geminicoccaceae bacterium]MDW8371294.1 hypothetical protein [Geminicoccaceae bacterium]